MIGIRMSFHMLAMILVAILGGCAGGEPAANETMRIRLSASPAKVRNQGETAVIRVLASESDGRPVLDGLRIHLSADMGTVDPEVRTLEGEATAVFTSDSRVGTVVITATAGDATPTTIELEVEDRNRAVNLARLVATPDNLTNLGGQISLRLALFDGDGLPIEDKTAVFSSSHGRLANNGAVLKSDHDGQVFDTLFLDRLGESVEEVRVHAFVDGVQETATVSITPNASPTPVMVISPEQPAVGETVFFNGESSLDSDGEIAHWHWDFGDGVTAEGSRVSHVFEGSRDYRVSLRVTDDSGASDGVDRLVTVGSNLPPTPVITWSPRDPKVGDIVFFDAAASTDADGRILSYDWNMGNGVNREGVAPAFAFTDARTYLITLRASDDGGAVGVATAELRVSGNQLPEAVISASPNSVRVDDLVSFDATASSDPDGEISRYSWSFGDGGRAEGELATHRYNNPGIYEAFLEVTDNNGGKSFDAIIVTVGDHEPPVAQINIAGQIARAGAPVSLSAAGSSDSDGEIVSYAWDFGDGTQGSGTQVQHTWFSPGDYTVSLRVTDNHGKSDSAISSLRVEAGAAPIPRLRIDPGELSEPGGRVVLDASATTDADHPSSALTYEFETIQPDDVAALLTNGTGPIRSLDINGASEGQAIFVVLTVRDPDGNEAGATEKIIISEGKRNARPLVQFELDQTKLTAPGGSVVLDASATTDEEDGLADLSFEFSAQHAGQGRILIPQTGGAVRIASISNVTAGDRVVFNLVVTDSQGAQDVAFAILDIVDP